MGFLSFIKNVFDGHEYIYFTPFNPDRCEDILEYKFSNKPYEKLRGYTSPQGFCLWVKICGHNLFYREFEARYTMDFNELTIIRGRFKLNLLIKFLFTFLDYAVFFYIIIIFLISLSQTRSIEEIDPLMYLIFAIFACVNVIIMSVGLMLGKMEDRYITWFIESNLAAVRLPDTHVED